jgi:hypothetical protein
MKIYLNHVGLKNFGGFNMANKFLSNAFSLSMLNLPEANLVVKEIPAEEVKRDLKDGFTSAVGHQSTAEILSTLLEISVATNRVSISLKKGDVLYVFQLLTRLQEGQVLSADEIKNLPYKFFRVEIL